MAESSDRFLLAVSEYQQFYQPTHEKREPVDIDCAGTNSENISTVQSHHQLIKALRFDSASVRLSRQARIGDRLLF